MRVHWKGGVLDVTRDTVQKDTRHLPIFGLTQKGGVIIVGLLLLALFTLAISLVLTVGSRNWLLIERQYLSDLKTRSVARNMVKDLNIIGQLNSVLKSLHRIYNGCRLGSIILPPVYASCEAVRLSIQATALTARVKLTTITFNPDTSQFTLELKPWSLWWLQYRIENCPTSGLPLRLFHPSVDSSKDISLTQSGTKKLSVMSRAHISSCGSECTNHQWRFGG